MNTRISFVLSVCLHVSVLFALLFTHAPNKSLKAPSQLTFVKKETLETIKPVKAQMVNKKQVLAEVKRLEQREQKAQTKKLHLEKQLKAEQAKLEAEKRQLEQDKRAQKKQLDKERFAAKKWQAQAQKERLVAQKLKKEQEALKLAEKKAFKAQKAKEEAEAKRQAFEAQMAKETHRFISAISRAVEENRQYATHLPQEIETKISFRLLPDGRVQNLRISQPSGYPAYDESSLMGVKKAVPFTMPADPELRRRLATEITLEFKNAYEAV